MWQKILVAAHDACSFLSESTKDTWIATNVTTIHVPKLDKTMYFLAKVCLFFLVIIGIFGPPIHLITI